MTNAARTITWVESADGTPIALHCLGGDGPPMMIAHATGFHARCYEPMVPVFGEHFTVWAVDMRGHGRSQIAESAEFDWHDLTDDLLAAIDHVADGPIPAFGHSMGGAAILMAETKRPGTIAAAYVFEPIIFPTDVGPRNSSMPDNAAKRRAVFPSRADALARYASRPPLDQLRADALSAYVDGGFVDTDDGQVRLACRPVHEAMTFRNAGIPVTHVAGVQAPVTVARGIMPEGHSAARFAAGTAAALANAQLVTHDHVGHFGPLEWPAVIAAEALTTLRR